MAGNLVPVVLFPRFTVLAGPGTFSTIGMDVTEYEKAILSFWRNAGTSGSAAPTITFEESMDQLIWSTCGGGPFNDPGANTEGQFQPTFTKRWFRASITLSGGSPAFTLWLLGFLQMRET